jgi:amino acid permease
MMGSAVLVLPINVLMGGLSLSMIVMTLMAFVSYYTCAYVVKI